MIAFSKMHGLGNDYIYIDVRISHLEDPPAVARKVSDRHCGIGSDGLVLLCPSAHADLRMRMFNADGSEGGTCGNALRCIGWRLHQEAPERTTFSVETSDRTVVVTVIKRPHGDLFEVAMGAPSFEPSAIPIAASTPLWDNSLDGIPDLSWSAVSIGNPHVVAVVPAISDKLVLGIGPRVERHPLFPQRVNVEFVEILSRERIRMRVWERGSGETLACGSGACAAVVVTATLGHTERACVVELLGGELEVIWREDGTVVQRGPAVEICRGEFHSR